VNVRHHLRVCVFVSVCACVRVYVCFQDRQAVVGEGQVRLIQVCVQTICVRGSIKIECAGAC